MKPQVIFITGIPGSGKSSVSEELCKKLEKAVHIQVDHLRQLVKAGYAIKWPHLSTHNFDLNLPHFCNL